jgi:hypothetical protein
MFEPEISDEQRQKAREFLAALTATPAPADDTELKATLAKRAELSGALQRVQSDGSLPLEEAASRVVLIRTQLELLDPRITTLEAARSSAEQRVMAGAAKTRKAAVELVTNAAYDVRDQARAEVEGLLRPWFQGRRIWEETTDNIPFIALLSERLDGMVRYGLTDQELLRRLEKLSAGGDFLDLDTAPPGRPEMRAEKQ